MKKEIKKLDQIISIKSLKIFSEKKSLISILFHGLFNDESQINLNHVDPQQLITLNKFKKVIEFFVKLDYKFVTPQEIYNGLNPNENHVFLTFDDGYFSNSLALPILKFFNVPATFFISSNHILNNKCFWWDIIYRERIKQGYSVKSISKEIRIQKTKKNKKIDEYIINEFGENAFNPISDIDRPFTPEELKIFSREKLVHIGNHCIDHEILTNYSFSEVKVIIENSQKALKSLTGKHPMIISYPNGNYSNDVILASEQNKLLKLGITTVEKKNYFPLFAKNKDKFLLKRFLIWGNKDIKLQTELMRSDIHLIKSFKNILR
jgi:peptidoglycan/xylan/chitin deacetylase (PgdA/CDA1 family)